MATVQVEAKDDLTDAENNEGLLRFYQTINKIFRINRSIQEHDPEEKISKLRLIAVSKYFFSERLMAYVFIFV